MQQFITYTLYLHIIAGGTALVTGALAIFSKKGGRLHRGTGRIYFWAMTVVFITGVTLASYQFNRFLFLIAFISYYSVFSGVRALKLKQLHKGQRPLWYDWLAGGLNTAANLLFVGLGIYYFVQAQGLHGGGLLSLGFGLGGLALSHTNIKPFVVQPNKAYHWYLTHIGNMMGGYIATTTAFLSTMVTRFDLMNPILAFALPSLIGVPLLIIWQRRLIKQFAR